MSSSITVLNQHRSEFDFLKLKINTQYNILIHCVYYTCNQFETEFEFLLNPNLDANTLVILWHPVEQGVFQPDWMAKLDRIVSQAPYILVYITGVSHKPNVSKIYPHCFDLRFLPVFDYRSAMIWNAHLYNPGPQPVTVNKSHKFMCLNAKDLVHRRYIYGQLIKNNLVKDGIVSYQCYGGQNTFTDDFDEGRGFTVKQLHDAKEMWDLCLPHMPLKIDDSDFSGKLPRDLYLNSYINIVLETNFINIQNGYNISFVTEKTFNAIANNQMFIIVGHAGSLDLLKSLGYKTFDSVINESYDTIVNNGNRLETVTFEIVRFLSRPHNDIQNDYAKVQDIILHNRNLLYSQNLETRLQSLVDSL